MDIDRICLKALNDWKTGRISEEECRKIITEHEEKIAFEIFNNGFSTENTYHSNPLT